MNDKFQFNTKDEFTWLRWREKYSRRKEQYVQKLGGSRVNPKGRRGPSVTTVDSER